MKTTKGNNPGKNVKGQASRAKKHHTGKINLKYIEDADSRAQALNKRHPTILKKMNDLSTLTKTEYLVKWKTESGSVGTHKTAGYSDGEDVQVPSITDSDSKGLDGNDTSTSEPTYPPPPPPGPSNQSVSCSESGKCEICCKKSITKKNKDLWLNCEFKKGCSYWVHCLCTGILAKSGEDLAEVKFFCPEHRQKFMK